MSQKRRARHRVRPCISSEPAAHDNGEDRPEKISDVNIVWQRGTESDHANDRLARLDLTQRSCHDCFYHSPSFFVQKVNFIYDQQPDLLSDITDKPPVSFNSFHISKTHRSELAFSSRFSGDYIPLLRSGDDDLGLGDFRFGHLHIASQLSDFDREPL